MTAAAGFRSGMARAADTERPEGVLAVTVCSEAAALATLAGSASRVARDNPARPTTTCRRDEEWVEMDCGFMSLPHLTG
jgi:hypothetical protein